MSTENQAETLLNKHQKSSKYKYMWITRDGTVFGTNSEDEIAEVREAVLKYNVKQKKSTTET